MSPDAPHWSRVLDPLRPCQGPGSGGAWASLMPSYASAWAWCRKPADLLWLAERCARTDEQRRVFARACTAIACDRAEAVLYLVPAGEDRPRIAIEAARGWLRGEVSIEALRAAAWAAGDAAEAAARAAAEAAEAASLATSAAIIRRRIEWSVVEKALHAQVKEVRP